MNVPVVSLAPVSGFAFKPKPNRGGRKKSSHCKRGHALIDENLYIYPNGERQCLTCRKMYVAVRWSNGHRTNQTRSHA